MFTDNPQGRKPPRFSPIAKITLYHLNPLPVPRIPFVSQICQLAIMMTPAAAPQERVCAKVRIRQLPGMVGLSGLVLFTAKVRKGKQRPPLPPRLLLGTDGSDG
jgi:hypothetical protein